MTLNVPTNTPVTSARVDMTVATNATWQDAFQFGVPTDTTWNFTGQSFRLDVKADMQGPALLTCTTANGLIVVDDPIQRVLNLNVSEALLAVLPPGAYVYDLIMQDTSSPPIRVQLMHGRIKVRLGITGG